MTKNQLRLFKVPCPRPGFEKYLDLYLVLTHGEDKTVVRVRTVFNRDISRLEKMAEPIESMENLQKYL